MIPDERNRDRRSGLDVADEGHADPVEVEVVLDVDGHDYRHDHLPEDLLPAADPDAGPGVQIVVDGSERTHQREHEERRIRGGVVGAEDV